MVVGVIFGRLGGFNEAGATMAPETMRDLRENLLQVRAASMRPGQQWPRKRFRALMLPPGSLCFNEAGATMAPETARMHWVSSGNPALQ